MEAVALPAVAAQGESFKLQVANGKWQVKKLRCDYNFLKQNHSEIEFLFFGVVFCLFFILYLLTKALQIKPIAQTNIDFISFS